MFGVGAGIRIVKNPDTYENQMVIVQKSGAHQKRWMPFSEEIVFGTDKMRDVSKMKSH